MNARKMTVWMSMIAVILLATESVQADIIGINSPSTSFASIVFDDTTSIPPTAPPNGAFYSTNTSPWNGSSFTMSMTTDATTGDQAKGNLYGTYTGPSTYSVSLNSVNLNQLAANTGYAHLDLRFNIEYQLDGSGLTNQPTLFPTFTVNGTVQPGGTGFANFGGTIQYYGMDSSYNPVLLDTVTYAPPSWTTPGPFNGTVAGVPNVGWTPQLPGTVGGNNSTLTLVGNFSFMVDPATISVVTAIPEPGSLVLLALGGLALIRRRCKA